MITTHLHIISWISVLLGISGNIVVILKNKYGFMIWLLSDIIALYVNLKIKLYSFAFISIVYSIICLFGFLKWRNNGKS